MHASHVRLSWPLRRNGMKLKPLHRDATEHIPSAHVHGATTKAKKAKTAT